MHLLLLFTLLAGMATCRPSHARTTTQWEPRAKSKWVDFSQFHFDPYQLIDTCIECLRPTDEEPMFNCSIKFDWVDPNSNGSSCTCRNEWQWDGVTTAHGEKNDYVTEYFPCYRSADAQEVFQFKFDSMASPANFSIWLAHSFWDSKDFFPPETAELFAMPNMLLVAQETTETSMVYALPGVFEANITGMT
ncbi:hypothetical protein F4778DRAFT_778848 [Xylariomycetidae sp. FL2044]|nr:hypothetical protein F4778DRAFT_778848 [Xylariomycetidae sp. FL2044]